MTRGKQIFNFLFIISAAMPLLAGGVARTGEFNIKKMAREENSRSVNRFAEEIKEVIAMLNLLPEWTENAGIKKWRRNLFYPLVIENEPKDNRSGADDSAGDDKSAFRLEGVFVGKDERFALINGEAVSDGDMVSGMRIVEISLNRVVLKSGKVKKELFFDK